jgi:hypothetical protein
MSNTPNLDLTPGKLKRPMDPMMRGNDSAVLNALCAELNNPELTGMQAPPRVKPVPAPAPAPEPAPECCAPEPRSDVFDSRKIAFTGRLKSGKDFLASAIHATTLGFADPIYFLLEQFHGVTNKDAHGAREFLQTTGQWGRGLVDGEHPLTFERGLFNAWVRSLHLEQQFLVDWDTFGENENIWLDAAVRRAEKCEGRVVISNVRFNNEVVGLKNAGWAIFHVMCSQPTWKARLDAAGVKPGATRDVSEQLAAAIDQDVFRKLSKGRLGSKLRCVWCDDKVACPSPRLFTVDEFVKGFGS